MLGNDAEAQKNFEKILALEPGNYAFHLDLADIHFKRKEYKKAEERITAYLTKRPNDREAKLLLGRLYSEMGNRTHAIQVFEELVKADPNDTEALAAIAELHKDAGEVEKALRTADKLVNLQGKRATPDDLSELNNSLEFYENAVKAYSPDVKEMWNKNLKLLTDSAQEEDGETDMSLFMGAVEKAPLVDEETEALFIEDPEAEPEEEDLFLDDSIPLMEEEPFPDVSLDNLAEPSAAAPSEASPGTPAEAPAASLPQESAYPDNPEPSYPPSQEPPYPDYPPYQPEQQAPYPQQPESGQPESEQQPGQSEPGQSEPEQPEYPQYPEYPEMPHYPDYPENPPQRPPASTPEDNAESLPIDEPDDEVSLLDEGEELPEDWEEDVPDEELPGGEPVEPVPEESEEFPVEEPPEEPEELPEEELLPADEQPEEESSLVEAEEPSAGSPLEELSPAEEQPDTSPESSEQENAAKPDESENPEERTAKDKIVGLMNYLKNLAGALPESKRENFMKSDARLSMEYVINTLKGKKGLLKEIKEKVPEARSYRPSTPETPDNQQVAGTLSYLGNLTSALPDKDLFSALKQKVQRIMSRIKAITEKRK
jgi:hypothetical protein